jgi:hypothetical protein
MCKVIIYKNIYIQYIYTAVPVPQVVCGVVSSPELIQGPGVLPNRGGTSLYIYIYIRGIRKNGL